MKAMPKTKELIFCLLCIMSASLASSSSAPTAPPTPDPGSGLTLPTSDPAAPPIPASPISPVAPPTPAAAPVISDWRLLALSPDQEISPELYYKLLDVTEADFAAAASEEPPRDRAAVLNAKISARLTAIDVGAPRPFTDEEKLYIAEALQSAAAFLVSYENIRLYSLLGQGAYTTVMQKYRNLLQAFEGRSSTDILKITAQFFVSILQRLEEQKALEAALKPELFISLPIEPDIVHKALGSVLFASMNDQHKDKLNLWVHANPAEEPLTQPYLNNIIKEYIALLQCAINGSSCRTEENSEEDDTGNDTDTPATPGSTRAPGSSTAIDKRVLDEFEKANSKLYLALGNLEKARDYLPNVKTPAERKFIKERIKQTLADNNLKAIADGIKNNKNIPELAKFIDYVHQIYGLANTF